MMRTTRSKMADAFAEVECLDFLIVAIITEESIECPGGLWDSFPPVSVNESISGHNADVAMLMVGVRSTGQIVAPFSHDEKTGKWTCLMSEEEREKHGATWVGQAQERMAGTPA